MHQANESKQNFAGFVHLALDGWTSPLVSSYLGIILIWYASGKIHRAVLEYLHLYERHTGKYMAEQVANCLKRFKLADKLHTICMDNASNCDTLALRLGWLIPSFLGTLSRTRCFAHIVNLIAKVSYYSDMAVVCF